MTRNLDIFFRPTEENAAALLNALLQLGAPFHNVHPSDLLLGGEHVQLQTPTAL